VPGRIAVRSHDGQLSKPEMHRVIAAIWLISAQTAWGLRMEGTAVSNHARKNDARRRQDRFAINRRAALQDLHASLPPVDHGSHQGDLDGGDVMGAREMSRDEAVALVQKIMDADYALEEEADHWLDMLDRVLACPTGYVSGLIFWPPERELSANEVVDQALAYRPIAL
jgi:hypothetical protein